MNFNNSIAPCGVTEIVGGFVEASSFFHSCKLATTISYLLSTQTAVYSRTISVFVLEGSVVGISTLNPVSFISYSEELPSFNPYQPIK